MLHGLYLVQLGMTEHNPDTILKQFTGCCRCFCIVLTSKVCSYLTAWAEVSLEHILPSLTHCTWISDNRKDTDNCDCWSPYPSKHKGWNWCHKNKTMKKFNYVELALPSDKNVSSITMITTSDFINRGKYRSHH